MRGCVFLSIVLFGVIGLVPAPHSAQGAPAPEVIAFHVTVGGAVSDSGSVSAPQGMVTGITGETDFNGCALVKNKVTQPPFGAYRFEIHINLMSGINMMLDGLRPHVKQEVQLEVLNYRGAVSRYDAKLSLAFVIGGHLYFTGTHTTVMMRNGGLDGTVRSRDVLRSYPTRLADLTLQATWHCTGMFHVQGKV